jgi:hypothetical protein
MILGFERSRADRFVSRSVVILGDHQDVIIHFKVWLLPDWDRLGHDNRRWQIGCF